jgi:ribosomal protein L23
MTRHGKLKGRGRMKTRRPDWKRAIVTLAEGQTVEFL